MKQLILFILALFITIPAVAIKDGDFVQVATGQFEGQFGKVINASREGYAVQTPERNIPALLTAGQLKVISESTYNGLMAANFPTKWAERKAKMFLNNNSNSVEALKAKLAASLEVAQELEEQIERASAQAQAKSTAVFDLKLEQYLSSYSDSAKEDLFKEVLAEWKACRLQ